MPQIRRPELYTIKRARSLVGLQPPPRFTMPKFTSFKGKARLHPYMGAAAALASRAVRYYKKSGSRTKTRTKNAERGEIGPSTYHESKTLYRRRPRSKRYRRRWKKFKSKVRAVTAHDKPRSVALRLQVQRNGLTSNDAQAVHMVSLYSQSHATDAYHDDIRQVIKVANQSATTTLNQLTHYLFTNAQMECIFTNASNSLTFYLDVYWCYCRRDSVFLPFDLFRDGVMDSTANIFGDEAVTAQGTATDPGATGVANYGLTPYQSPSFCKHYKIVRKDRHYLAPGASIQVVWKDKKTRLFEATGEYEQTNQPIKKGWTKTWFFAAYAVNPALGNTTVTFPANTIQWSVNKIYTLATVETGSKRYLAYI